MKNLFNDRNNNKLFKTLTVVGTVMWSLPLIVTLTVTTAHAANECLLDDGFLAGFADGFDTTGGASASGGASSTACGNNASAGAVDSTAIGSDTIADSTRSTAIGAEAETNGDRSTAVGRDAHAGQASGAAIAAANATAIGAETDVRADHGTALGQDADVQNGAVYGIAMVVNLRLGTMRSAVSPLVVIPTIAKQALNQIRPIQ